MQLAGASLLSDADLLDADRRWSARRTLLFILASNGALWWMIAHALRAVV